MSRSPMFLIASLLLSLAVTQTINYIPIPLVVPPADTSDTLWEGAFYPNGTLEPNDFLAFSINLPSVSKGYALSLYLYAQNSTWNSNYTGSEITIELTNAKGSFDVTQSIDCITIDCEDYDPEFPDITTCDPSTGLWYFSATNTGNATTSFVLYIAVNEGGWLTCDAVSEIEKILKYIIGGAIGLTVLILLCIGACVFCCIRNRMKAHAHRHHHHEYARVPTND